MSSASLASYRLLSHFAKTNKKREESPEEFIQYCIASVTQKFYEDIGFGEIPKSAGEYWIREAWIDCCKDCLEQDEFIATISPRKTALALWGYMNDNHKKSKSGSLYAAEQDTSFPSSGESDSKAASAEFSSQGRFMFGAGPGGTMDGTCGDPEGIGYYDSGRYMHDEWYYRGTPSARPIGKLADKMTQNELMDKLFEDALGAKSAKKQKA